MTCRSTVRDATGRRIRSAASALAVVLAAGLGTQASPPPASAQDHGAHHRPPTETGGFAAPPGLAAPREAEADPPLFDDLGVLAWTVATSSPEAQRFADQGLRLAFAFNHPEALRAYRAAQRHDPSCAMCAWGEAYALGPNINAPMDPAAVPAAVAAVGRAQALASSAGEEERAAIGAMAERYSADPSADRAALDAAYADAMAAAAERFPENDHLQVLAAEALMDLAPWDYWADGGRTPKGRTAEALAFLERVLERNPDHPGAIHFHIHLVEASDRPERAEPYADRLAALMPGAGHIVHMPSHVYYRVGRFRDSLEANRAAVAADERYLARAGGPPTLYRYTYYPHNVHFLMVSAQMAGDGPTAIDAARKLAAAISDDVVRQVPWVQPIKAAPYFAHARYGDPAETLALPHPGLGFPYVAAMWHYARAAALIVRGDLAAAAQEREVVRDWAETGDFAGLEAGGVPAGGVVRLAGRVLDGRLATARGEHDEAVRIYRDAVAIEDGLPYMEPPFWYFPVRQALGAAQLRAGDAEGAQATLRESLAEVPHDGWALFGLMKAQEARGDQTAARETLDLLEEAWAGDKADLDLDRF
jgi:tetratricopeptide (TPR) repeat protein